MHARRLVPALAAAALGLAFLTSARAEAAAPATAKGLCDALLASMKEGSHVGFAERRDQLSPEIRQDFDLSFMTRIVVGPEWRTFTPAERQQLVDAFSDYSVATYAQRFNSYSGERFEVDPAPSALADGDTVVHTRLYTGDPDPVQLDYLMRKEDGRWRIIDVYLNGTISELAARRSEYSTILRQGGAAALVALLRKKSTEFGS
jgi:phospholipid transport system substrate-binding protein